MIFYLIRHGESTYNAEGRIQGQSDVPLSELGLRQSRAVADALADSTFDAIYSSPLQRAYTVAKDIASRHDLPIRTDPRLKEISVGEFQDRMRVDLEAEHPEKLARWRTGDVDYAFPGGETRRQLADRGVEVFRHIAASGHRNVIIVAHGGLLVHTLRRLVDSPNDSLFGLRNCSITKLSVDDRGRFEMLSFDEVDHLGDVGVSLGKDL